jgi:hypothetical protein
MAGENLVLLSNTGQRGAVFEPFYTSVFNEKTAAFGVIVRAWKS